ncbi:HVO_A0114 family putative DNA-binding protein [Rhodopila globiformis]|uniref:HTH marR-type domain-containing protein n=1 Tax=Rhodopila globiformis TaxID=1071 RepID=A0A2S6NIZ1_RHOGL|nr:hypothetical protein [Rhodopila globiformis]PPQ34607.1 hypothetical protein CCS01_10145 [Rhodopila globiformis]
MIDRTIKVTVGTTLHDDLDGVAEAWERAERGEDVQHHVVAFENLEAFTSIMTPEPLRLLKTLRLHPAPSIRALSRMLNRDYRRVHGDIAALEQAGLVEWSPSGLQATADRVSVEVDLVA